MNFISVSTTKFASFLKLFSIELALMLFILLAPHPVDAGFFSSLLSNLTPEASAAREVDAPEVNSQTMHLLQAVANTNPSANLSSELAMVTDGTALMTESGPVGTTADVNEAVSSTAISLYTVRTGDSFERIAKIFGVSVNTILWANNMTRSSTLQPGQQLVILPISGVRHVVKSGDTLSSIAKKYNVNADEVAEFNELSISATLTVGDEIIVPDAEIVVPSAPKVPSNVAKNPTAKLHDAGGPSYPGYYIRPISGGTRTQGLHGYNAVDLAAPVGTPIIASAKGVVIISSSNGSWNHGYGNYVVIAHSNGTQTLYAHMSQTLVSVGEQVDQGTMLGKIGMTGKTTGPHIHFEIRGAKNPF